MPRPAVGGGCGRQAQRDIGMGPKRPCSSWAPVAGVRGQPGPSGSERGSCPDRERGSEYSDPVLSPSVRGPGRTLCGEITQAAGKKLLGPPWHYNQRRDPGARPVETPPPGGGAERSHAVPGCCSVVASRRQAEA